MYYEKMVDLIAGPRIGKDSKLLNIDFNKNDNNTIYFLKLFFFDNDIDNYLKVIEKMCEEDIKIFKTDQKIEHISNDKNWIDKYVKIITLEDLDICKY